MVVVGVCLYYLNPGKTVVEGGYFDYPALSLLDA